MRRLAMAVAIACAAMIANADELTIEALKAQGAKRLDEAAIRSLLVWQAGDKYYFTHAIRGQPAVIPFTVR